MHWTKAPPKPKRPKPTVDDILARIQRAHELSDCPFRQAKAAAILEARRDLKRAKGAA